MPFALRMIGAFRINRFALGKERTAELSVALTVDDSRSLVPLSDSFACCERTGWPHLEYRAKTLYRRMPMSRPQSVQRWFCLA
jgi:hypothetical protein